MTPLLTAATLALIAREDPLQDPNYATYCIESASWLVADETGHNDWLGLAGDGTSIPVVAAPRRAVMIAEQLAKRAYLNPDAIVQEGGVGPIGGDRTVEEFARTFEFTDAELEYLQSVALGKTKGGGLWTQPTENLPVGTPADSTIYLPDLDPRAQWWPVGTEGVDDYAYTPLVP